MPLRRQSAEVLALLAASPGRAVAKDVISRRIWAGTAVTDDSLVQCIGDIRRALDDADHTLVQTLPKVGYRLNVHAARGRRDRGRWVATGALLALAVGVWAWTALPNSAAPPDRPRLAVLAFDDFSSGADEGVLSDAMLAYRIQELAYGGLKKETIERLEALGEQLDGGSITKRRIWADIRPIAGTRLIREWQGVEHAVTVRAEDFEYEGRPYKSLSAIARAITGTRWNGWIFFGLKNQRQGGKG